MLLKCQTSASLKRVSQQAGQPGSATAGSSSSSGIGSNQFVSGFGASRQPASGKGKGKGGKCIRNAGSVGGTSSISIGAPQSLVSPSVGVAAKLSLSPSSTITSKLHRKVLRIPSKRIPGRVHSGKLASVAGKLTATKQHLRQQQHHQLQQHSQFGLQPAPPQHPPTAATSGDNSNDSGLGFDRGIDSTSHHHHHQQQQQSATTTTTTSSGSLGSAAGRPIHHSR